MFTEAQGENNMDDWGFVACDDGCTQPLSYIKRGKKYYFAVAEVLGFGNTGEPKILDGFEFDKIELSIHTKSRLSGDKYEQILIGVKKGKNWGLWRYTEYDSENLVWQRPVESSLLCGRVLEIVPEISVPTLKEALDEYRKQYL